MIAKRAGLVPADLGSSLKALHASTAWLGLTSLLQELVHAQYALRASSSRVQALPPVWGALSASLAGRV
jgi:hypothetical protein